MKNAQCFLNSHVQNAQEKQVDDGMKMWYDKAKVVKSCVIFLYLRQKMVLEALF